MDHDLAYCLEHFINDQVKLIDEDLEEINQTEIKEEKDIKEKKDALIQRTSSNKIRGSHEDDQRIVDRFIDSLSNLPTDDESPKMKKLKHNLRIELSMKVETCLNYVTKLRDLAQSISRSDEFVVECDKFIKRLREDHESENIFRSLTHVIDQCNLRNLADNLEHWWTNSYGSDILKIIRLNNKYNPHVTKENVAVVLPYSRLIDCAQKVVEKRKSESTEKVSRKKHQNILEFIEQIRQGEETNQKILPSKDIIAQIETATIDDAIEYASNWLKERDRIRQIQKENEALDTLWNEKVVHFERQRIIQQTKKIALAAFLRRLAIGSENDEQFKRILDKMKEQQKQRDSIPIVIGEIRDPETQHTQIAIQLEKANYNTWSKNVNGIQNAFSSTLCRAFLIPVTSISVIRVEQAGVVIVHALVSPPYGKKVTDCLNGTATDSPQRIQAIAKSWDTSNGKIESITLGDMGLSIDNKLMDPKWNKIYRWPTDNNDAGDYWSGSIDRGGQPYFCPSGWRRFGIKVANNEHEFDKRWGNWHIAYHGTKSEYATDILTSGLRVSTQGCFYAKGIPRVYLSPSIEYCAHPRYAQPWKKVGKDGTTRWYQLVFQCRVNPNSISRKCTETLLRKEMKHLKIDPNFNNNEIEWILEGKTDVHYINVDIICYGLMLRISDVEPKRLPCSKWWSSVFFNDTT